MIRKGTELRVVDNTGAKKGVCIEVYGRKVGKIGDRVLMSIKSGGDWKGRKVLGLIVSTKGIGMENGVVLVKEVQGSKGGD